VNYLNLGCGRRRCAGWVNMDVAPQGPDVTPWNVVEPLPLGDASFDVVYHSHLLEHVPPDDAAEFLQECHRVLRPGGILRVVVPDLEGICRMYLQKLAEVTAGKAAAEADYDWMMLELMDQVTRQTSGGMMARLFSQAPLPNPDFVASRIGAEAKTILDGFTSQPVPSLRVVARQTVRRAARLVASRVLPPAAVKALQIGRFRLSGEVHQWMYDRFSLARALRRAGFVEPVVRGATESGIPGWSAFELDADGNGVVHKPDSLFMEAVR